MVIGTARRRVDDPLPGENKLMQDYRRRSKSPQERTYSSQLARAAILLTAAEGRAKTKRGAMETSTLREYTVLFAIVSELYRCFDPHVHRRADRADVD
jgi:hypothetical protein